MVSDSVIFAPPVKQLGKLRAVPMDIQRVNALVTIDAGDLWAVAVVRMWFRMGPAPGNAMFDLRQEIEGAWLDEAPIDSGLLGFHDLGGGQGAEMRVIGVPLEARSDHMLRVQYQVKQPGSAESHGIVWDPMRERILWDFFMSDLKPGRYLEQWFPANFIYDQFALRLEIRLRNAAEHRPVTNAVVTELGFNHWVLEFPERYTALSHMLILAPAESLETLHSSVGAIRVETTQLRSTGFELAEEQQRIHRWLEHYQAVVGPYAHEDRFTAYLWGNDRSMEYDGAVCSNPDALEHELFHSWFARGVKPATQNDGWIDEAWTMWSTEPNRFEVIPFDMSRPAVELCSSNPYNRATPGASYREGFRFFAGLASVMGVERLQEAMFELYRANPLRLLTTGELENHLSKRADVGPYFSRFVYGIDSSHDTT